MKTTSQFDRIEQSAELQALRNQIGILNDGMRQVATVLQVACELLTPPPAVKTVAGSLGGALAKLNGLIEQTNGSGVTAATLQAECDRMHREKVVSVARGNGHYQLCGCSICRAERGEPVMSLSL